MTNWTSVAESTAGIVNALAPIVGVAFPGASVGLELAAKILQGVMAGVPAAIALFNRIKAGQVPTRAELQKYSADYEDSYQKLKADIDAKLKTLPP